MLKQQITLQVQQPHITFNPPTLNLHPRFPFPSSCLGLPVLLSRPLCQGQLNTDMGNTEISDTDTDTGGNGAQSPFPPLPVHWIRMPYTIYYIYTVSRLLNPVSRIRLLSSLNCATTMANIFIVFQRLFRCFFFFALCLFVVVPFVVLIVVVVVVEYLYLLQVFVCRFTASISIFGPSSAAGSNSAKIPFCPLWHGRVLIPFNGLHKYKTTRQALQTEEQ